MAGFSDFMAFLIAVTLVAGFLLILLFIMYLVVNTFLVMLGLNPTFWQVIATMIILHILAPATRTK